MRDPLPPRPDVARRPDVPPPPAPPARPARRWWLAALTTVLLVLAAAISAVVAFRDDRVPQARQPTSPTPTSRTASPDPAGHAGEADAEAPFRFLRRSPADDPVRWDPCEPIHYEVNLDGAPAHAPRLIGQVVARASAATGIRFVDDGTTTRTAAFTGSRDYATYGDGRIIDLPVLISWVSAEGFSVYGNPRRYAAVGIPVRGTNDDEWWYVSGQIVVNRGTPAPASFAYRGALGPLLLHEWGHVLGLAHVRDGDQLMYSRDLVGADRDPSLSLTDYAEGDLEGLAELGRASGCQPG